MLKQCKIEYSLHHPAVMTFMLDNQEHQFSSHAEVRQFLKGQGTMEGTADEGRQMLLNLGEGG